MAANKISQSKLTQRLARLEGQVKALRIMVDGKGDWEKSIILAVAIEGAADQVTADLFQSFLESSAAGKVVAKDARRVLDIILKRL